MKLTSQVEDTSDAGFLQYANWSLDGLLVAFIAFAVLLSLVFTLIHRLATPRSPKTQVQLAVTRPALALILVGTLVLLAAYAMKHGDDQTRNLLVGGVVSLSSAAAAYYFSSTGASEARRDLLQATTGVSVPDLTGKTLAQAQAIVSQLNLRLLVAETLTEPATPIVSQSPAAGFKSLAGETVLVTLQK